MGRALQPDDLATILAELRRRLKAVETHPHLQRASIKNGALTILDPADDVRAKFGRLDADLDLDGDPDWGLVIFDDAGDWALLGTKAGVFVRGIIDASIIVGSTITGGTIRTDDSGRRVELSGGEQDRIRFYTGNVAETFAGYLGVSNTGQLLLTAPELGGPTGGAVVLEPGRAALVAELVEIFADTVNFSVGVGDFNIDGDVDIDGGLDVSGSIEVGGSVDVAGGYQIDNHPAWRGGVLGGATNGAGDFTIPHGLGAQPAGASVTIAADGATSLPYTPTLQNVDPTNLTVRVFDSTTGAVVGAGVSLNYWWTVVG